MLDLSTHVWLPITAPADHASSPGARGYHNLLVTGASLFLFGGAQCAPGCVCNNELWHLPLRTLVTAADALLLATHAHNSSGTGGGGSYRDSLHGSVAAAPSLDTAMWSIIERDERVGASSRSAEEVIRAGDWPVHRYRQSLTLFRGDAGASQLCRRSLSQICRMPL
jgi:hypothetical protein